MDKNMAIFFPLRWISQSSIKLRILVAMLVAIPIAGILWSSPAQNQDHKPPLIGWQHYSPTAIKACLESGRPAMVFVYADWHINSGYMRNTTLKSALIERVIREQNVSCFLADYSRLDKTEDGSVVSLVQELSPKGVVPFIAIFHIRQSSKPIVFLSAVREAELANTLASTSSCEN